MAKAAAKKPTGRPSTFDPAKVDEIIERVSTGEPLAQVCRDEHLPALRTFYDWMAGNAEIAARFARAREAGFDMIAVDALNIADERPERTATEHGDKVDAGYVAWQKNRVEQRMKLLAKWDPKRYGEKIAVGGADDLPAVKHEASVVVDPSEAYKRLLGND